MIVKTEKDAVRINGLRSLLLCDNEIHVSMERANYKPLLTLPSPERAQGVFKGLLSGLSSGGFFYVYDETHWLRAGEHKHPNAYVCFDGMLVRVDDVEKISIVDDRPAVKLSFADEQEFSYDFASEEEAVFAFNAIAENANTPGVLLLEYRGDDELMVYHID